LNSLQGHLLVAAVDLRDPNFFHTVVLLIRHDENGAFGVVLNRPSNTRLKEVWSKISKSRCATNELLYVGGPVQGPLLALHCNAELSQLPVIPGVYLSTDSEELELLAADAQQRVKFFIGYAGWGAGQLEGEMEQGSWRTIEATPDLVFEGDEALWIRVTRQINDALLVKHLRIKHVPEAPWLN
jgi:putative transcriptional regulator